MSEGYICRRCAAVNSTCCALDHSEAGTCFPLSQAEIRRFYQAGLRHGLTEDTMYAAEPNSPLFIEAMQKLFPGEKEVVRRQFPVYGLHLRIGLTGLGACVFLTPRGCMLTTMERPWFCRLFPFWVRKGKIHVFTQETCLAVQELCGLVGLMRAFTTSSQEILQLYADLRAGWGLEKV